MSSKRNGAAAALELEQADQVHAGGAVWPGRTKFKGRDGTIYRVGIWPTDGEGHYVD